MILNVSRSGATWPLGTLAPGQEWLAFVFRSQSPRPLTIEEFESLVADHDGIVREAYSRMTLEASHKWTKGTEEEVSFVVEALNLPPGASVLDIGCGKGRHTLELARRGYQVTGVDFVPGFVAAARRSAAEAGLSERAVFDLADARSLELGRNFDAVLCLYDVVGSFPNAGQNQRIIAAAAAHLEPGRPFLMSVLNRGLIEAEAIHRGSIRDHLDTFLDLPPSNTMQKSGEIFNPRYYFFDPTTSLVYRKEQFVLDGSTPCELVVRDMRYGKADLEAACRHAGIEPVWTRHVCVGGWAEDYSPGDSRAKELLLLGTRK